VWQGAEEISQAEMAKKLKISRQKLNDFEHGRRFPSLGMAADMAKALGEHAPAWISVVIEEMLREEDLDFKVTLAGWPILSNGATQFHARVPAP
jgi:transcriptional regulator with XRE-family HTH domain